MDKLTIRPKNYGVLSSTVYNAVESKINDIEVIAISDSSRPATQIIELDMVKLLHQAVMGYLSEQGVTKINASENDNYMNGLNTNLDELFIDVKDGRMRVHVVRDHQTNMSFLNEVKQSLKNT